MHGVQIWRLGNVPPSYGRPLRGNRRLSMLWGHVRVHLGEIASCQTTISEALSLAKELKDMNALAMALLFWAVILGLEGNPAEVARLQRSPFSSRVSVGAPQG
jgi:hypothetical protein